MNKREERRAKAALRRLGVMKRVGGRDVLDLVRYFNPTSWRGWDAWGCDGPASDAPPPSECLRWFPGNGQKTVALVKAYIKDMRAAPRTVADGCMILLPLVMSERDQLRNWIDIATFDLADEQLVMLHEDVERWARVARKRKEG